MKPMDHAEKIAKIALEAALPGANLEFRPDQSHMEYDFDLRYPNGSVAAVEVTSSRNQVVTQTNAEIFNKQRGGTGIKAVRCKKSWLIFPSPNAHIKDIRKGADKYLAELEAAGLEEIDCFRTRGFPECVQKICVDLKLISGAVFSSEPAPGITLSGVGGSGAVGPTCATKAGEKEAEANKEKLGKAVTEERHLVVYVDQMNDLPYVALTSFEPPSVLPNLPKEITHIWLVTEYEKADQFVVWYGSKTESWRRLILPTEEYLKKADILTSSFAQ